MKMWAVTFVDTGDTCDGKPRILCVHDTREKAYEAAMSDMDCWLSFHSGEGAEIDKDKMSAHFDYKSSDGCEWNIEEIEVGIDLGK